MTDDQKHSICDIYGNQKYIDNAENFYQNHNVILGGIEIGDKLSTVNNIHNIQGSYVDYESDIYFKKPNEYPNDFEYTPLMSIPETLYINNNHKLISSKDIDYENAYLKYAANQISEYKNPISYTDMYMDENTHELVINSYTTSSYIFDREITPYINNTYDLINIVDYLFNRVNCFYFLLGYVKKQNNLLTK